MTPKKYIRDVESRRKQVNEPNFPQNDNVEKFINSFANQFIAVEKGLGSKVIL